MGSQLPPKRGTPQFSVHVYCGQTAMDEDANVIGTEVDLGGSAQATLY